MDMEEQMREIDPVSGNEVPAGSLPEEVRDDVDAKLSAGEYVVPADVVRYFGVKFFEDLRSKAKEDLGQMDEDGRIGGEPEMGETEMHEAGESTDMESSEDMSELSPADLEKLKAMVGGQEPVMAAEGALITGYPKASQMDIKDDTDMLIDRIINTVQKSKDLQTKLHSKGVQFSVGGLVGEADILRGLQSIPAFADGGMVEAAKSTFNPNQFNLGFSTSSMPTFDSQLDSTDIEMVTYVNADGYKIQIRTINGTPIDPVPAGYFPETANITKQSQPSGGSSDPFAQMAAPTPAEGGSLNLPFGGDFDPYNMTPKELLESVSSTAKWGKSASLLGGALGPAGMLVSGIASAAGKGRMVALGNVAQTLADEARQKGNDALADEYLSVADSVKNVSGLGVDYASQRYTNRWTENRGKSKSDTTAEAIPTGGSSSSSTPAAAQSTKPEPQATPSATPTTRPTVRPKSSSSYVKSREQAQAERQAREDQKYGISGLNRGGLVKKPNR